MYIELSSRKGDIVKKLPLCDIFPIWRWRRDRQIYEVAKLKFKKSTFYKVYKNYKSPIFKTPGKVSK